MTEKQYEAEIKYRLSVLLLLKCYEDKKITNDELLKLKKKLIRKYKPLIGCLEIDI